MPSSCRISKDELLEECKTWYQNKVTEGYYEGTKTWPKKQDLKKLMTARQFVEKQVVIPDGSKLYCFIGLRLMTEAELVTAAAAGSLPAGTESESDAVDRANAHLGSSVAMIDTLD